MAFAKISPLPSLDGERDELVDASQAGQPARHVPFADEGSVISCPFENLQEADVLIPPCGQVVLDPVCMSILPGEKTPPAGRAERGRHERV